MRLPSLRPKEIERILLKTGFMIDTQKGSHRTCYNPQTKKHTTIAFHTGTVPKGTLRGIINQTGMTREEFLSFR